MSDPAPQRLRHLTGNEETVLFFDADEFTGVDSTWLLPRLRLDPACRELDLFERVGLTVYVDDELVEDIDPHQVITGEWRALCTYGNGDIIGGGSDLIGDWLEDWAPEIRHRLTWMGDDARPLRQLALMKIAEGKDCWEPQSGDLFEVTSPFLDPSNTDDASSVLTLSGEASRVTLNGMAIWPIDHDKAQGKSP